MITKHPLTDTICEELSSCITILNAGDADPYISPFDVECDMQRAADWQLKQVKEEVKRNLILLREARYFFAADTCENFFEEIMKAMRPPMTRQQQLAALFAQLQELTTEEERRNYPFWDPLNDLINDLEMEDDN